MAAFFYDESNWEDPAAYEAALEKKFDSYALFDVSMVVNEKSKMKFEEGGFATNFMDPYYIVVGGFVNVFLVPLQLLVLFIGVTSFIFTGNTVLASIFQVDEQVYLNTA